MADVFSGNAVNFDGSGGMELSAPANPGSEMTLEVWLKPGSVYSLQCFYANFKEFTELTGGIINFSLRLTEDKRLLFSALSGVLPLCELGTITQATPMAINPQATLTQQLGAEDFTPVDWKRTNWDILRALKINNDGLLTFTGTTACDIWLSGVAITPLHGFSAQVRSAMGSEDITWSIVSVTPGVLSNAASPPSISEDGILSMEF